MTLAPSRPEAPPPGASPAPRARASGDRPRAGRRPAVEAALSAVLAAGATVVLAVLVLRPWPLGGPVSYEGDALQHLAIVRATDWAGTPGRDAALAAPWGLDWSVFPTGTERLPLAALHWLHVATGDLVAAMDLWAVVALGATAAISAVVLRWLGLRRGPAVGAAVLFALSPAATARLAAGHLFLFPLWWVPVAAYLAVWSTDPSRREPRSVRRTRRVRTIGASRNGGGWRRWVMPGLAVAVVATTSAYATVFTAVAVLGVGAAVALGARRPRRLLVPLAVVAGLGLVALASSAPQLAARWSGSLGTAATAVERPAEDSSRYRLRPEVALSPRDGHPLPPLAAWGRAVADPDAPGDRSGEPGQTLGMVAVAGLVALAAGAAAALRRRGRSAGHRSAAGPVGPGAAHADGPVPGDGVLLRLAVLAAAALLAGWVGGPLVADAGFTQVRVWSRLVSVVAFAALAGGALVLQRALGGRRLPVAAVVAVVVVGLVDAGVSVAPPGAPARRQEDVATAAALDRLLPEGGRVLELPVVSFPDHLGAERALALPLADRGGLRWSAGGFRGTSSDWQRTLAAQGTATAVSGAAAAGFDAVVLQRTRRLLGDVAAAERAVSGVAGRPAGRSDGGRWVWWDLRPLRERMVAADGAAAVARRGRDAVRPLGVAVEGAAGLEATGWEGEYLVGERATVVLHRFDGDTSPAVLRTTVRAAPGAVVRVGGRVLRPGPDGEPVTVRLPMRRATARVDVDVDGPPVPPSVLAGTTDPGSAGTVRARLSGLQVLPVP